MTFEKAVSTYADFIEVDVDTARDKLLAFLGWEHAEDGVFNEEGDVRIVLVSAEFSIELTTAVLWLLWHDVEIRCVRMKPYLHNGTLIVDVQPIIPLPEADAYTVGVREKSREERQVRQSSKDLTKFDVTINGITESGLAERQAILRVVKHLCTSGVTPEQVAGCVPWKGMRLFKYADGQLDAAKFIAAVGSAADREGAAFDPKRYFCDPAELIYVNGRTYAFTNQWGRRSPEVMDTLLKAFPGRNVTYQVSVSE